MSIKEQRQPVRSRPRMKEYGINSDESGMMNYADVESKLTSARNYWVSCTQANQKPHASPVWAVWFEGALYFSCGLSSVKWRSLTQNPAVVIHLESGDDVVILEGSAKRLTDQEFYNRVRDEYGKKYAFTPEELLTPENYWFMIQPDTVLAWLESDFPNTATRWTF